MTDRELERGLLSILVQSNPPYWEEKSEAFLVIRPEITVRKFTVLT